MLVVLCLFLIVVTQKAVIAGDYGKDLVADGTTVKKSWRAVIDVLIYD